MLFDFDSQEFYTRHEIELMEFQQREKMEASAFPLEVIYNQLKMWQKPSKEKILWITLNPPEGIDIVQFINKVHSLVDRSYLPDINYTFEQRGETIDTLGRGVHCHILVSKKKGVTPKQIINNLESLFKKFMSRNSVDVREYPATYRKEKLDYLNGNKWDEDKAKKVEIDKLFRQKYNLNPFY